MESFLFLADLLTGYEPGMERRPPARQVPLPTSTCRVGDRRSGSWAALNPKKWVRIGTMNHLACSNEFGVPALAGSLSKLRSAPNRLKPGHQTGRFMERSPRTFIAPCALEHSTFNIQLSTPKGREKTTFGVGC